MLTLSLLGLFVGFSEEVPQFTELRKFSGEAVELKNSTATIKHKNDELILDYPCICNYGWGYNAFKRNSQMSAMGIVNKDGEVDVWELSIEDQRIFSYEELSSERLEARQEYLSWGGWGAAISALFCLPLLIGPRSKKRQIEDITDEA